MAGNLIRDSRVRYERSGSLSTPQLHLKAFVSGVVGIDVIMPATDPLFLGPGFAGEIGYRSTNQSQVNSIINSPRSDDFSIVGSGGYSFADNFNRIDASTWGASWNEQHTGGNAVRYVIRSNEGVEVYSSLAPPGFYSFNTPVAQPSLSDAVMQFTLGTITLFHARTVRLRSSSVIPGAGVTMYMLEVDGTTVGSPNAGQLILWHVTITGASSDTPVELARISPGDPFWIPGRQLIPGAVVVFSATVE